MKLRILNETLAAVQKDDIEAALIRSLIARLVLSKQTAFLVEKQLTEPNTADLVVLLEQFSQEAAADEQYQQARKAYCHIWRQ